MKSDPLFKYLAATVLIGAVFAFSHLTDARMEAAARADTTVVFDIPLTP